jgi:hypothetical protein
LGLGDGAMTTKSTRSRSRARVNDTAPTQPYIQTVADAAARSALDQFANSPERKEELHRIMTAAIAGTLERFGLDPDDKASVEKFRANMIHLNDWREFTQLVRTNGIGAATSWFVKGLLAVIALGLLAVMSGVKLPGH